MRTVADVLLALLFLLPLAACEADDPEDVEADTCDLYAMNGEACFGWPVDGTTEACEDRLSDLAAADINGAGDNCEANGVAYYECLAALSCVDWEEAQANDEYPCGYAACD